MLSLYGYYMPIMRYFKNIPGENGKLAVYRVDVSISIGLRCSLSVSGSAP